MTKSSVFIGILTGAAGVVVGEFVLKWLKDRGKL